LSRENKRTTGINGLDQALEGGFPTGTTVLVMGSAVSGTDLLARQFWQSEGEEGTYLMLDAEVQPGMVDGRSLTADEFITKLNGQKLVIDSLSSFILKFGIDAGVKCILQARDLAVTRQANVVFTFYPELHPKVEEILVMRAVDLVLELKEVIFMNEIERQLAVHKISGMAVPRRLIPFLITEKGIELSTTSRVV
jgi:KaiC/GvpD/RAD55 family RecA-like ATPase